MSKSKKMLAAEKKATDDKAALDKKLEQEKATELSHPPSTILRPDLMMRNSKEANLSVQGEDADLVLELYKNKFSKNPDGTDNPNYKEPVKNPDGSISFWFSSDTEASAFFMEAAGTKARFMVTDENHNVMAYSNGDGKLYHASGAEFKTGDVMKPSDISSDKFQMPEPGLEKSALRPHPPTTRSG